MTLMMVCALLVAPILSSSSLAPPINRLTMKSFQRLATIATRSPSALSRPWIVLANRSLLFNGRELGRSREHHESKFDHIALAIVQLSNFGQYRFRVRAMSSNDKL